MPRRRIMSSESRAERRYWHRLDTIVRRAMNGEITESEVDEVLAEAGIVESDAEEIRAVVSSNSERGEE